ncbi:phosphatidylglycerophosphatase A family protein [Ferrimonas balearica]|uniref:phosphatidylglycerophosphatase A family protein n=1 Tax=Ferrimonas balearica TaxID=44012 RepID=UPI001C565089|nr:phosphatidylglycerophosphatase A [Ferrimonas balearica]MBY6018044.1 phosphatidylglycerophosphatase A [Halomonas denitrificans]MBW3137941.1 phosphatidylglycerophosphatase A [Ferrimonas balearica]MBW3164492.1 phosphatidylglycerophosphatase A [Ferrimonas balearica]MBY6094382.1 phosphatidylglycerophosphatase A [Ferrimonas balearica]MBY6104947.1 phosphatidylglycerophosphatase A [Ferrimonas balearica]
MSRLAERLPGLRLTNPVHFLAVGFGLGLARKAPGTWGTLAALPFYFLMADLSLPLYLGITAVMGVVGIYLCGKTAEDMNTHDHPAIVWDEVVGMLITMAMLPAGWPWMVGAFVAFRFFDILKPWPIRLLDKHVHGGLGIMIDDVLAGVFALGVVQLAAALL